MIEKIEKIILDSLVDMNDELEGNPLGNPTKETKLYR